MLFGKLLKKREQIQGLTIKSLSWGDESELTEVGRALINFIPEDARSSDLKRLIVEAQECVDKINEQFKINHD